MKHYACYLMSVLFFLNFQNLSLATAAAADDQRTVQKLECVDDTNRPTGGHGYYKQVSLIRNKTGKYDVFSLMKGPGMAYVEKEDPKILAKNLDCKFSKNDLRVVECQRWEEEYSPSTRTTNNVFSGFSSKKRIDTEVHFYSKDLIDRHTTSLIISINSRFVDPQAGENEVEFVVAKSDTPSARMFSKCEVISN